MRIKNTTQYSTRAIRSVLTVVHNHIAKTEGRMKRWDRFVVQIGYTKTSRTRGWAWLGNAHTGPTYWAWSAFGTHKGAKVTPGAKAPDAVLRLPMPRAKPDGGEYWRADEHDLAWLAYHEFMHSYGYNHSQYSNIPKAELDELFPENRALPS